MSPGREPHESTEGVGGEVDVGVQVGLPAVLGVTSGEGVDAAVRLGTGDGLRLAPTECVAVVLHVLGPTEVARGDSVKEAGSSTLHDKV